MRPEFEEQRRREAELKARVRRQSILAELGQRALVSTDLAVLRHEAASLVSQTLAVDYTHVFELAPETNTLLLRAAIGWPQEQINAFSLELHCDSDLSYTFQTQSPIIVEDFHSQSQFGRPALAGPVQVSGGMNIVIRGRRDKFGVLGVYTIRPRTFSEDEIDFLQTVANILGMAAERMQSETLVIRRNLQLLTLQSAGMTITSNLEIQYVLNTVTREMINLLDVEACIIYGWNEATDTISVLAVYHPDDWPAPPALDKRLALADYPLIRQVLRERLTLHTTADQTELTPVELEHMQAAGIDTLLMLPMIFQGRLVGLVEILDRGKRSFAEQEIVLAQLLANQAASAIENARLFKQSQTALEETGALYQVAHNLAQMDNEREMFELVLAEFLQHLNLRRGGVVIMNEARTSGTLRAYIGAEKFTESELQMPLAGSPLYEQVIETGEPLFIKDVLQNPFVSPARELLAKLGVKSLLLVPIVVRGAVIGLLVADAVDASREFTEREIALAGAMANQLGIAIENKRLQAETERHALQLTVLHELDRALASSLHLRDIYHAFAQHAVRLLPCTHMSITLLEDEEIRVNYVLDPSPDAGALAVGERLPRQGSAVGWVITQRQPLLRHNLAADTRFAEDETLVSRGVRSVMIIPLRVKGHVLGTWNIGRQQISAFGPEEMEIGQSMADQLAITIENARLYDEIHQYLEELHTLNMISQAINSTLDLQKILTIITEHTMRLVRVEAASVVLRDDARGDLWFAATSGGGSDALQGERLALGQGIVGWVVQHGDPALVPDVSHDPRFFKEIDRHSKFTTRSILCVPLQAKGQTIGAVEALNKEIGLFDQEDLRLLTSLVAPAATAIENARLFEQAQQEIAERQRAEAALEKERALLARRVAERTADLSAANAELARAARLKDEFLASMSHELRTPLTAILGLADVLKLEVYGPLTEKQIKSMNSIEESGRHLLDLINDILDLSKIEAGKLELDLAPLSIQAVCQSSLQFIKQSATKKQLGIFSTYDESVTTLVADERRLKQILVNLLSNAVKFTPDGGQIGLEVRDAPDRQMVNFVVWDTGIGIAQDDIRHLFQPFVQLDSRLARQYTGTGLGLALVRRMVEMHAGGISVESEVNRGTRF
ncbi:MAG: GAF domain-containing protein, partial [Chloroflexota bacterium]